MVSFDVVSLFTAIPVDRACEKVNKETTLKHRTKLSIDDIIKLLRSTHSNSFFNQNKLSYYKQIHGCTMGSPVSPILTNFCMEEIEELAHSQSRSPPKKWFRYVDDIFPSLKTMR